MRELTGDLWTLPGDWRVITTNGDVKFNGECVMGAGVARQAKQRFPGFAKIVGARIDAEGNHVHVFPDQGVVTFPVKHHWYNRASLDLIEKSTQALVRLAQTRPEEVFLLPRPGCGNGGRLWLAEVKPILIRVGLPDNVIVVNLD